MLFESFGFRYIGPIDGNNISQVIDALERAKEQDGPVLIHALTVKGKGYLPAENDPVTYHGVGPFNAGNGKITKSNFPKPPSYTKIFGETLVDLCKQDPRIVAITAAMPDGTGLNILQKEMPERVYDVGIAEQHAVTFAAALACEGMRPVCSIYSTFLQRAYDQVIHDVCIQNLPVIFVLDRAGLVGADGPTHHGVFDISYLRTLPNMTIMSPKNEIELRDMILTAVNHTKGPIAIRYPRGETLGLDTSKPPKNIKIGQAEVTRVGKDVLLVGLGNTVIFAEAAAEILEQNYGIYCSVLNTRFVKPLDQKLFNSEICKHDLIITIEDHSTTGGLGSAVLEFAADNNLLNYRNFIRLGVPDKFIEHGTQAELYKLCGYDISSIVKTVLNRKSSDQKIPANY
jgi:1-deoxy-D-xylulose-5-phosphate synthase